MELASREFPCFCLIESCICDPYLDVIFVDIPRMINFLWD